MEALIAVLAPALSVACILAAVFCALVLLYLLQMGPRRFRKFQRDIKAGVKGYDTSDDAIRVAISRR